MIKFIALLNKKREHFTNRLKLRKGNLFYLLFAKKLPNNYKRQDGVSIYKYKNHIYFIQHYKLQTYINKNISRSEERKLKIYETYKNKIA